MSLQDHQQNLLPDYPDNHLVKVGREVLYKGDDLPTAASEYALAEAVMANKSHRAHGKNLTWIRDGLIYRQVNKK